MRRCLLAVVVLTVACGSETPTNPSPIPTTPTPAPTVANIAGQWVGDVRYTDGDTRRGFGIVVTLQQFEDRVTGTWTHDISPTVVSGEIAGTLTGFGVDTRLSGSMTWAGDSSTNASVRCVARIAIAGTASPPTMRWTSDRLAWENCIGEYSAVAITLFR